MSGTAKTRSALITQLNSAIYDNNNNEIDAIAVNQLMQDLIASCYNSLDDGSVSSPMVKNTTLTAGVNTIVFSGALASTNFQVFINALSEDISFGVPYDKTVNGFKINSETGGAISYFAILNV